MSVEDVFDEIMSSTNPEDKPFKRWITSEVLPTIRKTGRYELPEDSPWRADRRLERLMDELQVEQALAYYEEVKARVEAQKAISSE